MIKYRIFGSNEEYIDAIGEYVYISVHIRGTSVNFQKEGGFILSIDNLQNEYKFIDDDDKEVMPSFRNDFTSIRCESIDECIEKLNNNDNYITYEELLEKINTEHLSDYDIIRYEANLYKYNDIIKQSDKIYFDKIDRSEIFIIVNHKKVLEELHEINNYCKNNNISFHWI